MGTLYLVTLESDDWRTKDEQRLYKMGITTDNVDKYIQKSYSTKHPTKHMRHVRSWSGVPEVRKVEQHILKIAQHDQEVKQFEAVGTTTSEFIFIVSNLEDKLCGWLESNIELALRDTLHQGTLTLSTYNIEVDSKQRVYQLWPTVETKWH